MTIVRTAVDAWAREDVPAKNYGTAVRLWINGGAGTNDRLAYLHFTRPFPLGATILSAKLRVFTRGAWAGTQLLTAKRITERWAEARINWNNAPTVVATNAASLSVVGAANGQMLELDVAPMLADVSGGGAYFGFRLELDTDVSRALHSSEALDAALRPVLEVEWVEAPDAPDRLAPSGGRAVSLAKPRLSWRYSDPGGSGEQASSQVQIATDEAFTLIEYDSGKLANELQEWDLNATAYAGLAADAIRYWRVRVWDDTDLVSEWSDIVDFTRKTHGTLTLVSPAAATVDDLSPPVDWTFTGRTQEAYQVQLWREPEGGGNFEEVWDTGRVTSTATTVTVPEKRIVSGRTYRITVRVWDTLDRQGITGDPAYKQADSPDFTYARSGLPDPVTVLDVVALPDSSGAIVQVEWQRAVQPDYFALVVDGVEVEPRLLPADVFVSGTTYRIPFYARARPRVAHAYEVEAVVLSAGKLQHSDGNATAVFATDPHDIWLVDEEHEEYARIGGPSDVDFAIGESGTTFHLPGRRSPVRITDTVRGYEGTVEGTLRGKAQRDAFLRMKGRLKPLRLIVSDLAIPVELEEVSAPPTPLSEDRLYGCTFGFFQVDDFTFRVTGG